MVFDHTVKTVEVYCRACDTIVMCFYGQDLWREDLKTNMCDDCYSNWKEFLHGHIG